jgi:hypothetical protein
MSIGVTGIIRPSTVDLEDIEVYYSYAIDRTYKPSSFIKLNTTDVLEKKFIDETSNEVFQGFYTLKLNSELFSELGFYNVYLRPKQIRTTILDCGVLSQLPDQKGLILDINASELRNLTDKLKSGGLTGFRIEYLNLDGLSIIPNLFRTVTFSNRCEAISQTSNQSTQKSIVYRFNDNGTLLFLSVSPSVAPSVKPNSLPDIGVAGQEIILSNTFFDPQMIEFELTEYDLKKVATLINGERTLNIETGIQNIYDKERNIVSQSVLYDIKDEKNTPLYKVKKNNETIDETETWDTINEGLDV